MLLNLFKYWGLNIDGSARILTIVSEIIVKQGVYKIIDYKKSLEEYLNDFSHSFLLMTLGYPM